MSIPQYLRSLFGPDPPRVGIAVLTLSGLIVVAGTWHAGMLGWLSDDIFITFRYIDQWFAGNGLVYNPGEYVEGYTHPLWLLLLSGWRLAGFDMIGGSILFGVVSQALLLVVLVLVSWKLAGRAWLAFPAAAAAVAWHHDAAVWATSGLETGLFTLLVTVSVVLVAMGDLRDRRQVFASGSTLVLATLTRPDGVLILMTAGIIVVLRAWANNVSRGAMRKTLFWFALPSGVFVPYALWKLVYYGNLLPNTYYAKSGGGSYFDQGFTYISLFVQGHPSTGLILVSAIALLIGVRWSAGVRQAVNAVFADARLSLSFVSLTVLAVYLVLFVARVGGDFMYARFIVPMVPLIYLGAEAGIRRLLGGHRGPVLTALVVVPLLAGPIDGLSRERLFAAREGGEPVPGDGTTGIIDEHAFWTRPVTDDGQNAIVMLRGIGERLRVYFEGLTVRVLIRGQASMAYDARPTEVIENWGLTDPYIAHLEIIGRGRIGHEKAAPMEYIVARRVHFFFFKTFTPSDTSSYRIVEFDLPYGWSRAEMHFYDRDLMRQLALRFPESIRFVDFERYLDAYLAGADRRSRRDLEEDFARFKAYYFNHNFDPEREKRFVEEIRKKM